MPRRMVVRIALVSVVFVALFAVLAFASHRSGRHIPKLLPNRLEADGSTVLPNGWKVSPVGDTIDLSGDMPASIKLAKDGKTAFVMCSGFNHQGLRQIDVATHQILHTVELPHTWCGLAVSDSAVYVSLGSKGIARYPISNGELVVKPDAQASGLPAKSWIAGLTLLPNGALAAADIAGGSVLILGGEDLVQTSSISVGYAPTALAVSPDGASLAVANLGDGSVSMIDLKAMAVAATVKTGNHPNDLAYASDGRLFVTNGGSNSVSVIAGGKVVETLSTSLTPKAPVGSTPISVAVDEANHRLYVANADNNDVAVFGLGKLGDATKPMGFLPTAWYPSSVAVVPETGALLVGTGKGTQFGPNGKVITPTEGPSHPSFKYIGMMLQGHMSFISMPDEAALAADTKVVMNNAPFIHPRSVPKAVAAEITKDVFRKIKHVVYIIRENRTYDQVLGDDSRGNGDPNLVMFGADVTPNAHRLASQFVLLDNLYCDGEVSEDGHEWCNAAYVTEFKEKTWENSYSQRGEPDGDDRLTASPAGYLWDNCAKHGVSYFSYGEYADFKADPDHAPVFDGAKSLTGHASEEWTGVRHSGQQLRDYTKMDTFISDLDKAEKTGKWPAFTVMSLGEDHTSGLKAGAYTPKAAVASNDLALGKLVSAVTHSRFWKETAIFVIEDDAQNGPDHVDAHRTVGLFISPYTRRGSVDGTLYTTSSMVHTMELMLGLPTMTQYDAAATPFFACVTKVADVTPYDLANETEDLEARNASNTALARRSSRLDFSGYDRANPDELNAILWAALKPGKPQPAPVRSALHG